MRVENLNTRYETSERRKMKSLNSARKSEEKKVQKDKVVPIYTLHVYVKSPDDDGEKTKEDER